jgi:membrane associated rhomboid family serine protease
MKDSIRPLLDWASENDSASSRTIIVVFVILLAFYIEVNLANAIGYSGPYSMINDAEPPALYLIQIFSPVIHSSYNHVVGNLFYLVPLSLILAYRVEIDQYFLFMYITGFSANFLFPAAFSLLGMSVGAAVGASSVTYGMASREFVVHVGSVIGGILGDDMNILSIVSFAVVSVIFLMYVSKLLQGPTGGGSSFVAHFGGSVIGFVWGAREIVSSAGT